MGYLDDTFFRYITQLGILGFLLITTLWGFSVVFVYLHASTHYKNNWFWPIVALLVPFGGALIYIAYYYGEHFLHIWFQKKRRRGVVGDYVVQPRTIEAVLQHEEINILASYRDRQIEKLIIDGKPPEAQELIKKRIKEAAEKGDTVAMETLHYYLRVVNQYGPDYAIPKILLSLWEDEPAEGQEPVEDGA